MPLVNPPPKRVRPPVKPIGSGKLTKPVGPGGISRGTPYTLADRLKSFNNRGNTSANDSRVNAAKRRLQQTVGKRETIKRKTS
jgi:hypothetical protein